MIACMNSFSLLIIIILVLGNHLFFGRFNKNCCSCYFIIEIVLFFLICIIEFFLFLVDFQKINYPCRKKVESSGNTEYTYYVYYYRRLDSDFDCTNLPENYNAWIFTKVETALVFVTVIYSFILIFFKSIIIDKILSYLDKQREVTIHNNAPIVTNIPTVNIETTEPKSKEPIQEKISK